MVFHDLALSHKLSSFLKPYSMLTQRNVGKTDESFIKMVTSQACDVFAEKTQTLRGKPASTYVFVLIFF